MNRILGLGMRGVWLPALLGGLCRVSFGVESPDPAETTAHRLCEVRFPVAEISLLEPPQIDLELSQVIAESPDTDLYLDAGLTLKMEAVALTATREQLREEWRSAEENRRFAGGQLRKGYLPTVETELAEFREQIAACRWVRVSYQRLQNEIVAQQNFLRVAWSENNRDRNEKDLLYLRLLEYQARLRLAQIDLQVSALQLKSAETTKNSLARAARLGVEGVNASVLRDAGRAVQTAAAERNAAREKLGICKFGLQQFSARMEFEPPNASPETQIKARLSKFLRLSSYPSPSPPSPALDEQTLAVARQLERSLYQRGWNHSDTQARKQELLERLQEREVSESTSTAALISVLK